MDESIKLLDDTLVFDDEELLLVIQLYKVIREGLRYQINSFLGMD